METKLTFAYKLCGLFAIWLSSSLLLFANATPPTNAPSEELSLSGTIDFTESFCGLCNGSIDLSPIGGQLPYTYIWSSGQTTEDLTDLCVGFYEVTVTDATGCTYAGSQFVGNVSYWDAILETQADVNEYIATYSDCPDVPGTLRIGTLFSEPASNITNISGLSFLNSVGSSVLVFQNPSLSSLDGLQNITSVGSSININSNNGLINLEGFPNVSEIAGDLFIDNHNNLMTLNGVNSVTSIGDDLYIANCQNLNNISALSQLQTIAGKLDIRICSDLTNLNGLQQVNTIGGDLILSQDFLLSDISALDHPINIAGNLTILETNLSECSVEPICLMLNNGAGSVVAENLMGCFTTNQILQGCSGSDVDVSFAYQLTTCAGSCDGSISVTVTGTNPPYSYLWSTGDTEPFISSICAGFYELTVTDNTGAASPFSVELFETLPIEAAYNVLNPACFGACNGEIVVTVAGGNPPYAIELPSDICAGLNEFTVTDANGCVITESFDMPGTNSFDIVVDNIQDATQGMSNGSIDITINDGTPPFTYAWMLNGIFVSSDEDPANLTPGDYSLTAADAEGCEQTFGPITVGGMVNTNFIKDQNTISIFPNPASEFITIHFDKNPSSYSQYTIYNAIGKQMISGQLDPTSITNEAINVESLAPGVYLLNIKTQDLTRTKKILIQ